MLLDGKTLSNKIKEELKVQVNSLIEKYASIPTLSIVVVGSNPASEIYVRNKIKTANSIGMNAEVVNLNENVSMEELIKVVDNLNDNKSVNGIIVQLPLPRHLNEQVIIDRISNIKDVDGFGLLNKGKLLAGEDSLRPATPYGIMKMLEAYNIELAGKNALVIGRSNIVGKPIALMLLEKNATVTIAHSKTKNIGEIAKNADIIVVAVGKPKFLTADMVKEEAIIVDVGINRDNGVLCGDVDFDEVSKKASFITPVPGGVGPLTIVSLLENTIKAYIKQKTN
jgi:methylenetetrahydrofolate dehydrogenase (NADP+)/methenyltetrahydrofolate cyclohydrolase